MPAGQADALLDVGGTEHLPVDHAVGDVRSEPSDRGECCVGDVVTDGIPVPVAGVMGTYCEKTLMTWAPGAATDGSYAVWK